MKITRKIFGILKIILSLLWIGIAVLTLVFGLKGLIWFGNQAERTIGISLENISGVKTMMTEIADVMDAVDESLSVVETSMIDGGLVLRESIPLVDKTSQLIVEYVPQAMEDIHDSMPAVVEAARTIEQTMTLLSSFKVAIPNPFGKDFQFDLGLDYSPEVSLEDSLSDLNSSLENIPGQMRTMEGDFISADISMSVMSENLLGIAHSLDKVREQLADINPEIEGMVANMEQVHGLLENSRSHLPLLLNTARVALIILVILFILTQIPSIYQGYQLYQDHETGEKGEMNMDKEE